MRKDEPMHDDRHDEPTPDPVLGAALRDVLANAPVDAVDWSALERRVAARAAPALRRRRRRVRTWSPAPWWELTAGWARTAIPLGAAAAIAASVLAVTAPASSPTPALSERDALFGAVATVVPEHEALNTLVGSQSNDYWLLEATGAAAGGSPEATKESRP